MRTFLLFCLFFTITVTTHANPLQDKAPQFDIKKANQQYDRINLDLSIQNVNFTNLNNAVNSLSELITEADNCVEVAQKRLNNIELLIKQGATPGNDNKQAADLVYLGKEQHDLTTRQGQCRLFSIRAKEAVDTYKTALTTLKKQETIARGLPVWSAIKQIAETPPNLSLDNLPNIILPDHFYSPLSWLFMISASALLSRFIIKRCQKSRAIRKYLRANKLGFKHNLLLTTSCMMGMIAAYLYIYLPASNEMPLLLSLASLVFGYLLLISSIVFFFKLKLIHAFFYWYALDEDFFHSFINVCLSFYALSILDHILDNTIITTGMLSQLNDSLFLIAILMTGIYYIHYFCKAHAHLLFIKKHKKSIKRRITLLLLGVALLDISGYHNLAKDLTFSGFITLVILFITILINHGINRFYLLINEHEKTKSTIIRLFGYKKEQSFNEFFILKLTLQVIVMAISLFLIGESWQVASYYIEEAYSQLVNGIHIANFTLYPARIVIGMIVFCLLYLLFRGISTRISRHQQFEDEEETQVAIASILTYLGFGVAVISGLLIAGFDFTGLAIIAGALSVGIGLGLQSIVNNFVSGLILLIEKPIQPGDRISVDGVEGFVKKIRVRSTQLVTPAREDIVIPNSDLITRRVTNYTFSDNYWRVACDIGVAYGSNIETVRDLLLDVANNHPEVIKGGRNKPQVLLKAFAENALSFSLTCLIRDVNKKSLVQSDLNFAIVHCFQQNKIIIPFPQRDVHLHLSDA